MKKIIYLLGFLTTSLVFAQDSIKTNGLFYKGSFGITFTVNENYTLTEDDDESLLNPSAFLVNNSIGYQFDDRSLIGLNLEYNYHSRQGFHFLPLHLSFQYNLFDFDDEIFVRGGYGILLGIGKSFEKGTLYKLGTGVRIYDDNFKNSWLIGFDFSRKRFGYKQAEKLSSVSLFLEYMVF
jgi:hypothetical protein